MVEKGVINYLNFIKGVCIILVILLHSIPYAHWRISLAGAWLDQAVPIFLFITAYLTYYSFERGKNFKIYFSINSFKKMINRIFFPFLFLIIIQLTILPIIGHQMPAKQVVMWGGGRSRILLPLAISPSMVFYTNYYLYSAKVVNCKINYNSSWIRSIN